VTIQTHKSKEYHTSYYAVAVTLFQNDVSTAELKDIETLVKLYEDSQSFTWWFKPAVKRKVKHLVKDHHKIIDIAADATKDDILSDLKN
jgi:predicted DNA-binding ArsR family transcriptional regulator